MSDTNIATVPTLTAPLLHSVKMEFDGFTFFMPITDAMIVPFLYLAANARRGDPLAIEVLTASKVNIMDVNGVLYWPEQKAGKVTVVEETHFPTHYHPNALVATDLG